MNRAMGSSSMSGDHGLGGNYHDPATLAELNALISDADLIDTTDSRLSDARNDPAAFHVDIQSEISSTTAKTTPTAADFLLIEDAAAGNVKKRITIADLPGGGGSSPTYEAHVASDTLLVAEAAAPSSLAIHSNKGAPGIVVLTLPVTMPPVGKGFLFLRMTAQLLRIKPSAGHNIQYSGNAATVATKYLEIGTDTSLGVMEVVSDGTIHWLVTREQDTFTEEP